MQRISTVLDGGHLDRVPVIWLRRGWPHLYAEFVHVLPRLAECV